MQKFLCAKTSAVKPVHHYVDRLFYISGTSLVPGLVLTFLIRER
ncbi:hypothetical protein KIS1582_4689 [Cytobacillus firmus]|uniref:Uncharacterized protein n=1 Tax=Cytobacillus firmus TaxID=1399 RepID=A0A800N8I8_CYTFI|nr:hypothetical protein KIS1582_4689 [Cytobacillus firmus]